MCQNFPKSDFIHTYKQTQVHLVNSATRLDTRFCLNIQLQHVWSILHILKFLVNTLSKSQICNLQNITGEIKTVIKYSNNKVEISIAQKCNILFCYT